MADLTLLAPELQPLCAEFLDDLTEAGIKGVVCQTYRTPSYQASLVASGASRVQNSFHCRTLSDGTPASLAFDCMAERDGVLVSSGADPVYTQMGAVWKALGAKYAVDCTWGGDFHHPDPDHFSIGEH